MRVFLISNHSNKSQPDRFKPASILFKTKPFSIQLFYYSITPFHYYPKPYHMPLIAKHPMYSQLILLISLQAKVV